MKKIIVIMGILFSLSVILSFLSLYYTRKIEKEMESGVPAVSGAPKLAAPAEKKRELAVSDPEKYGMVVTDEDSVPRTQEEWDELISKKVQEAKSQLSIEAEEKVADKIKEDPQKTAEKMKLLDENIQKCQEALKGDPGNKEVKEKLERLRILKSIVRKLP